MALVKTESGCKVGWSTYDNKAEAETASKDAAERAERMAEVGYDFGYQWPGEIREYVDGGVTMYRVTTP